MKTKLVYVLTCAPEATYIEQALMSAWSARHWNPDAHIVLITDNLTDKLLIGKRGEILNYISEKIVIPFEDDSLSMMYRSRFIKTSVRQLIDGDFMFIDCDTIVCKSLADVDDFACEVGAVWESHLLVKDFCDSLHEAASVNNAKIGVDIDKETEYFSSGILFVRELPIAYKLYDLWHSYWLESHALGVSIDQPSLAKANRDSGHIIKKIEDTYNCILFTQNTILRQSHVLHIAAYRNPCFLFSPRVLLQIRNEGLMPWTKELIVKPHITYLPFDYHIKTANWKQKRIWIKEIVSAADMYSRHIDESFADWKFGVGAETMIKKLFKKKCFGVGTCIWMSWKSCIVGKKKLIDNVCKRMC